MSFNITVEGGKSVRLPTKGKRCDRDIVVTAQGVALPELDNPGTAADLMEGKQMLDGAGNAVEGTFTITPELTEQGALIDQIKAALQGKAAGGSGLPTQEKAVQITENGTVEVLSDDGYTLSKVTAQVAVPIPEGYVKPAGALEVTENGSYDVTGYASVTVNVTEPDPLADFQRVEYITSDGASYVVTDFIADNSSGLEMIASFPALVDKPPMGSRTDTGATRFYCVYPLSANSCYFGFNTGSTISCPLVVDTVYRLQTNFMNSRLVNIITEAGVRKGGTTINATLAQQNVPVSIFGYHHGGTNTINSIRAFTLYGARISKGNDVVREYIPCYRKSNGVIGLYEKFTGTFWTTPVGAFTKGPDIDWEVAA